MAMKIAFYNPTNINYLSGPENWIIDAANTLADQKCNVTIFTTGHLKIQKRISVYKSLRDNNIKVIEIKSFNLPFSGSPVPIGFLKYLNGKYDYVYFNNGLAFQDLFIYFMSIFWKTKLIYAVHAPLITKYCLHNVYQKLIAQYFISHSYSVHVLNNEDKKYLMKINNNTILIEPGFKDKLLVKNIPKERLYSSIFKIIFIGRLDDQKNILKLINIIKLMDKDKTTHFYIAGDGQYKNEVVEASKKLSNLTYYGYINNDNVRSLMRDKHIFLNISKYETYCISVLEALASGLPVIATNTKGICQDHGSEIFFVKLRTNFSNNEIVDEINELKSIYFNQKEKYLFIAEKSLKFAEKFVRSRQILKFVNTFFSNNLMENNEYLNKLIVLSKKNTIQTYSNTMFKKISKLINNQFAVNTVVDVGCGTGFNSKLLSKNFSKAKVYSVDYVQHNLDYGIARGNITYPILSNIYNLNIIFLRLNIRKVDMVFLGDVIEHLDNSKLALNNLFKILRFNGFLIIHTPNRLYSKFFRTPKDPTHIHEFSRSEITKLLNSNGFEICKIYASGIPLLNKINLRVSQRLAYSLFGEIAFKVIKILGPSMLLVARKRDKKI
jgi:glycosyltransferase involved in cell wall biosynthesis